MKRAAQPTLSIEGQHALDHYASALKQVEVFSAVTIRNYLSALRQFMAWCACHWREAWNEAPFTPRAVTPPLLIRYRTYLQTTVWLTPSSVNRAIMSLERYFARAARTQVIQQDPASSVKFVPTVAPAPRYLDDDKAGALLAAVNATGTVQDRTMMTLPLLMGLTGPATRRGADLLGLISQEHCFVPRLHSRGMRSRPGTGR